MTQWYGVGVIGTIVKVPVTMPVGPGKTPAPIDLHVATYQIGHIHVRADNDNATEGVGGSQAND